MTTKQQARQSLMAAAHDCPSRVDQVAFWEYQERVMEPLRTALRMIVEADESA